MEKKSRNYIVSLGKALCDATIFQSFDHVASLDKILHDKYPCLMESNNQQKLKKSEVKTQPDNSETKATPNPKRDWIRPIYNAYTLLSCDRRMKKSINQKMTG